jgi:hypothetical protein
VIAGTCELGLVGINHQFHILNFVGCIIIWSMDLLVIHNNTEEVNDNTPTKL